MTILPPGIAALEGSLALAPSDTGTIYNLVLMDARAGRREEAATQLDALARAAADDHRGISIEPAMAVDHTRGANRDRCRNRWQCNHEDQSQDYSSHACKSPAGREAHSP